MSGVEYQVSGIWPWTDRSNRSALRCVLPAASPPVNDRDRVIELVRDVSRVCRLVDHDMDWPATRRYQRRDPWQLGWFHRHGSEPSRDKDEQTGESKASAWQLQRRSSGRKWAGRVHLLTFAICWF